MKGNRTWLLALVVILALLGTAGAMATGSPESAAPSYFNYQGLLLDSGSGEPVADGTYSLTFTLYDHATSTNPANELWEQTQNVVVEDGLFNVLLGDLGASTWVDGRNLWLGITVAGESEMVPRQQLVSVPYALYAERVGAHDHLGETWSGSNNPLVVDGSFSGTDRAPLILSNSYADGDGLRVASAGRYGVYVGTADYGLNVASASQDGVYVTGADGDGLSVGSAGDDGLYVYSATDDGVHVNSAGDFGVYVASAGDNGIYILSAGFNGVDVDSTTYDGVYAHTAEVHHEYGFYTPDKIYVGTSMVGGGPQMIVAQNGDSGNLETGDVVAVSGAGPSPDGGEFPVPQVQKAGPGTDVAGVVYRRFVAEERAREAGPDGADEPRTRIHTRSTEGPAAPGDYLLIIVLGPAQVKADGTSAADVPSDSIQPGDRLVVSSTGRVIKAPQQMGEETSCPAGTIVGTAMGTPDAAQDGGLVWVLVMSR